MRLKKAMAFIMAFILTLVPAYAVSATNRADVYNRILFVIDCSNSMNYHDSNKLVHEIVKMFADGTYSENTEIGFVTYNDRILSSYPLTSMADINSRNAIKAEIDTIRRIGSTDIGMALNYGMDLLLDGHEEKSNSSIILLSDGETDLRTSQTGRTLADSYADEEKAYAKAKEINCPIYSVGISADGRLNTEYLQKIADSSNGKTYDIRDAASLIPVFSLLYADATGAEIVSENIMAEKEIPQSITIDISGLYSAETNIIVQSTMGLKDVEIEGESKSVILSESSRYTSLKIVDTDADSLKINFTANGSEEVKVNVIGFTNIFPNVSTKGSLSSAEVVIESKFTQLNSGNIITSEEFYKDMTAVLLVTDKSTGESETIPMNNIGGGFEAVYSNKSPKNSELQVIVEGNSYSGSSQILSVEFTNTPPENLSGLNDTLLKNKEVEYELSEHFTDADGDSLTYEIEAPQDNEMLAKIEDSKLIITPGEEGETEVTIKALDGRGGVALGFFDLNIVPLWIYYRNEIVIAGCILIALLIAYILLSRKNKVIPAAAVGVAPIVKSGARFSGARFEGYFLDTLSGKEIPVLNWQASYIDNKHTISLGELLSLMDVSEKLPESHKIFFEAGNNNTVIFYHNTDCIVGLGKLTIPPGKKEVLKYDDRLYIVFEDHVTELEIRYKRVRKKVSA